ncbi:hypothetical protein Poli38472_014089 [Pythium oligandrum]|uniref:Uncharacterized protein n=1 Tax=Pythium oligandrum TaxID=41045 RepID=A0A8K1CQG0_PYTOL|nr:hypothetical protein Poli38472_014089 [Pythium oligandrum]|eukprot:TMW66777.1 hypothetical protein Poli38472_014089 [Pythium oligandrum]
MTGASRTTQRQPRRHASLVSTTTTTASKPTPTKRPVKRASVARNAVEKENKTSLVHDAVRKTFVRVKPLVTNQDDVDECERLRGELERVLLDHQRQSDEIVALRALARSLKEEVEAMHSTRPSAFDKAPVRDGRHEFFRLDVELDALRSENARLEKRAEEVEQELDALRDFVAHELPRHEILAVQARAALESTRTQLRAEQAQNDQLRVQLARFQARSSVRVRVTKPETAAEGDEEDTHRYPDSRSYGKRDDDTSSVVSIAFSTTSAVSSQLHDDLQALDVELRRLHESLDRPQEPPEPMMYDGDGEVKGRCIR